MTLKISVPEAAATPDTIQFKLVLEDIQGEPDNILPTCFRTFQQISWIHNKLKRKFPTVVLPPLPEQPITSHIDDQDYVERKRLQVERLFQRIMERSELTEHADFIHFLSSDMSPTQVGPSSTGVLSFLKFNRVIKPSTDRGFKSYKASEMIEGNDQDTFHKHQIYILLQESYYGFIAESLNELIQIREGLGDVMTHMGDLVIETTQSKYRLGLGLKLDARDSQRNLDRKMQMLGLLMDELGFVFTRQGKEENMKFGDVMIEYKNSLDPLKVVFNARTIKLMDYVDQLKHRNKKRDRSDKLKLRLGINHPEVKQVIEEEKEVSESLSKSKKEFDQCQEKVKKEIHVFDIQKSKDLRKAIKDYVNLSIRYENTKLQNLEKTLQDMQQPIIRSTPFMYHAISPTTSSVSRDSITSSERQKKRREKKHLHQNYKELQKPLQSSASLPTRTVPEQDSDSTESGTSHAITDTRTALSASYDDRISTKNWLNE
ncbi:hypothetical protein MFLAVUS_005608 [Mucor flavus]|uniref:PX domain-containing protein n=1 Tax=Mucor flavus TaxID=439312 RepID=A0ABP9YZ85_9FUNG